MMPISQSSWEDKMINDEMMERLTSAWPIGGIRYMAGIHNMVGKYSCITDRSKWDSKT